MVPLPRLHAISPSVAASRYRTEVFANACVNWFTLALAALRQDGPAGPAIWLQTLVVTAWKGRSFWRNAGRLIFLAGVWNHLPRYRLLCWEGSLPQKPCSDQDAHFWRDFL